MARPHDPRANQKQRTRAAIVEAAIHLMRGGAAPSVADAAKAAKVSRATAYRYFPTPESLHLEIVGVTPAFRPAEELVESLEGDDSEARALSLLDLMNSLTFRNEAQMRMALKVYLDLWFAGHGKGEDAPPVREGRRMRWFERALSPARGCLTKAQWQRLNAAIALTTGVEAMVVMKDVCRLSDKDAQAVLHWAAEALLRAGLGDAARAAPRRTPKPRRAAASAR
ncbi:MAG: TetR family transcriptional regulator [Alphaproteobacteria bacterium]|nr:TetR family transcriptional regulator [Alphaproteobacteria bacterium]